MVDKYGYWEAGGVKFKNKLQAMYYATQQNVDVFFKYHNQVWTNFDRSQLGKVSLDFLYQERALQLREKYDHLILYYSGGSDSHQILHTFLSNNIKLDEVCVKWPKALIDGKLYNPDSTNLDASNYWSEWNFAVKPTLDWLREHRPEVKITIQDFMEDTSQIHMSSLFDYAATMRSGAMNLNRLLTGVVSDTDLRLTDKGLRVGHIYGIDKPSLTYDEDTKQVGMFFTDFAISCVCPGQDPDSAECFYWSPDLPLLPFEMAYAMSDYFNFNQHQLNFLFRRGNQPSLLPLDDIADFQHYLARKICYRSSWDNRFQTNKAKRTDRNDKYYFMFNDNEFENIKRDYLGGLTMHTEVLDNKFLITPDNYTTGAKTMSTMSFYVRTLD